MTVLLIRFNHTYLFDRVLLPLSRCSGNVPQGQGRLNCIVYHNTYKAGDTGELTVSPAKAVDPRPNPRHSDNAMAYMNEPYRNAVSIANALMERIIKEQTDDRDVALLAREWLAIENSKRQWRGLPPLKAISPREMLEGRKMKQANAASVTITELEEPTTNHPQTVPAPPEGEAPIATVVANDK